MLSAPSRGRGAVALLGAVAALAGGAALAGPAHAAVTRMAITSPSATAIYPAFDSWRPAPQNLAVGGTATGAGPIRIRCNGLAADGGEIVGNVLADLPAVTDGPFTALLDLNAIGSNVGRGCRLQPLPTDGLPADLSPFTGPVVFPQDDHRETIQDGPNSGAQRYFWAELNQRRSQTAFSDIASCGLCGGAFAEDERAAWSSFWTASWLGSYQPETDRTAAMIDGRESFFAGDLGDDAFRAYAGFPAITDQQLTPASDAGPGRLSASEAPVHCTTQPLAREQFGTVRLDPASCAAFVPTGVRFDRSYTPLDAGGRSWRVTDVVRSVDGRAHEIDLAYVNEIGNLEQPRIQVPWAADPGFRAWSPQMYGPLGVPAQLPATIYTQFDASEPAGFENPIGGLTVGPSLVGAALVDTGNGTALQTRYRRTVPAGGAIAIEQVVSTAPDEPAARTDGAAAERALLTSPLPDDPTPPNPPTPNPPTPPTPRVDPPRPHVPGPSTPAADATKPRLSKLARTKKGFRATLSEAARLTIAISRREAGRRAGRACRAPSRKLRRAKRCTRLTKVGTLRANGRAGVNAIAFKNRVGRRALKPGSYVASFVARDSAGNTSAKKIVRFNVRLA